MSTLYHTVSVLLADRSTLETQIETFLVDLHLSGETVIGFGLEWSHKVFDTEKPKPSRVVFCVGDMSLVVLWFGDKDSLYSLVRFLRKPNLTFVGMGIKRDLDEWEKECGIVYRNAVELGQLAASVLNDSRLNACGMDMLARKIGMPKIQTPTINFADMDSLRRHLGSNLRDPQQLEDEVANCYTYYRIGKQLLEDA